MPKDSFDAAISVDSTSIMVLMTSIFPAPIQNWLSLVASSVSWFGTDERIC